MKLPKFFSDTPKSPRPATAAELAAKVMEGEEAHKAALQAVDAARAVLAAERSEEAQAALKRAKAAAEDLADMLGIVRDDHAAAVAKEAAEERAKLEAKLAALDKKLSREGVLEAGREEAELEASLIFQLAQCRERRRGVRERFKAMEGERRAVALKLGLTVGPPSVGGTEADLAISTTPVIEILATKAPPETLLAGLLDDLKPIPKSYWPISTRFNV